MTKLRIDLATIPLAKADVARATFKVLIARGDPNVRLTTNDTVLELDYGPEDLKQFWNPMEFPNYKRPYDAMKDALSVGTREEIFEKAATQEHLDDLDRQLADARRACREMDYDAAPVPDVSGGLDKPGTEAVADLLATQPGMLIGGSHGDHTHRAPVIDMLEAGDMAADKGVGLLFIEELSEGVQPALDAFFASPPDAPMDAQLKAFLTAQAQTFKTDFLRMVEVAKTRGVRVVGTDTNDAKIWDDGCMAAHHEQRCAKQNADSARIMQAAVEKARQEGKPTKFVGLIGQAHSNTHEGGVPGISQLMGVPALTVDASGRLAQDREDPTKRGAPSAEKAAFVDAYLARMTEIHGDLYKAGVLDWTEQRAAAETMADYFIDRGALGPNTTIATLFDGPYIDNEIAAAKQRGETRAARKTELIGHLKAGEMDEFRRKLDQYHTEIPDLLTFDTGKDSSVLLAAVAAGQNDAIALCAAKGSPIDDPDLAEKLFDAALERRAEDLKTVSEEEADRRLSERLGALVAEGADPNGRNQLGNTPLQKLIDKGLAQHVGRMIDLGARADVRTAPEPPGAPTMTMVALAAKKGDAAALTVLIDKGADKDTVLPDGRPLIQAALEAGDIAVAKALVAKGAAIPAAMGAGGKTALHLAAAIGDQGLIDALIDAGADPAATDTAGETAAKALLVREVRTAIDEKVNGNRREALRLEGELEGTATALSEKEKALADRTAEVDRAKAVFDKPRRQQTMGEIRKWAQAYEAQQALQAEVDRLTAEKQRLETGLAAARDADPMKDLIAAAGTAADAALFSKNRAADAVALAQNYVGRAGTDDERQRAERALAQAKQALSTAEMELRVAERERDRLLQPQPLDEDLVRDAADSFARGAGGPTTVEAVEEAMQKPSTAYVLDALSADMIERKAQAEKLKTAIDAGDLVRMREVLDETPTLVNARVPGEEGSFDRTMLGYAASALKKDVMALLLERGADPDRRDRSDATALHRVFHGRQDAADQKALQAELVEMLRASGADMNAQDRLGMTPLHKAALDGNGDAIRTLMAGGANPDIEDARGWKAEDVAIATTKPEAEVALAEALGREISPPVVGDGEASVDTVTILMRATRCEDPADMERIREMYRDLYAQPAFRQMLDLLAADAAHGHAAGTDGEDKATGSETGLRIFIARHEQVGLLYNKPADAGVAHPHHTSPRGAYEEHAHVVQVGGAEAANHSVAGTLIHELTHCAARIVYGDETIPCEAPGDGNGYLKGDGTASAGLANDPYMQAIMADSKSAALFQPGATKGPDHAIHDTLFGRLASYKKRGDKALLQEYLVSVPQLIAQYGRDAVARVAPRLVDYYETQFSAKCQEVLASDRYDDIAGRLDNRALVTALGQEGRPGIAEPDHTVSAKDRRASVDGMMETLEALYTADKGTPKVEGKCSVPTGCGDYELTDPAAIRQRDKVLAKVRSALEKAYDGAEDLPREVSFDRLTRMTDELFRIATTQSGRAVAKSVEGAAAQLVRGARSDTLEARYATGERLSPAELAELTVMRAEDAAWRAANANPSGDPRPVVDLAKHDKLVAQMAAKFDTMFNPEDPAARRKMAAMLADRDAFLAAEVKALVDDGRAIRISGDVVKLDVKRAKTAWYAKLRQLAA